jgi:hypothetical protein
MNDAPRYRLNAAECLLAARICQPEYRRLFSTIATSWSASPFRMRQWISYWWSGWPRGPRRKLPKCCSFAPPPSSRADSGADAQPVKISRLAAGRANRGARPQPLGTTTC